MSIRSALIRSRSYCTRAGALLGALLLAACGGQNAQEIEVVRTVKRVHPRERMPRSTAQRLMPAGMRSRAGGMGKAGPGAAGPGGWTWITPKGWLEKAGAGMRAVSMVVPGDPPADLGVFVLPLSGMLDNVNRWRRQMGLPPAVQADLAPLKYEVRGQPAVLVDLRGAYQGSGGKQRFLGLLKVENDKMLSVKLIGAEGVVAANEDKFHAFVQGLRPKGAQQPAGSGAAGADGGGSPGDEAGLRGRLQWDVPDGWAEIRSASGQRIATFRIEGAPDLDVRINSLRGTGGGIDLIGRMWASMAGHPVPDAKALKALRRLTVLGHEGVLFDFEGEKVIAEGGKPVPTLLLGLMLPLDGETLFVRVIGTRENVAPQRGAFLALCQSLRMED